MGTYTQATSNNIMYECDSAECVCVCVFYYSSTPETVPLRSSSQRCDYVLSAVGVAGIYLSSCCVSVDLLELQQV